MRAVAVWSGGHVAAALKRFRFGGWSTGTARIKGCGLRAQAAGVCPRDLKPTTHNRTAGEV
ncbi:hypothetical protein GCM10008961_25860 [Deinococcus knuensis]|uniref:Uncharacterized protein n=1 Tax=Deinococcus knuensis TaxID=1837380 RepID=A0ABQ2SLA6_9DEIO|nr:hypothetical protein GCM10008961_25860 [Deinococcus knuensis]